MGHPGRGFDGARWALQGQCGAIAPHAGGARGVKSRCGGCGNAPAEGRQGQTPAGAVRPCLGGTGRQFVAQFFGLALQLLELAFLDLGFQMVGAGVFVGLLAL